MAPSPPTVPAVCSIGTLRSSAATSWLFVPSGRSNRIRLGLGDRVRLDPLLVVPVRRRKREVGCADTLRMHRVTSMQLGCPSRLSLPIDKLSVNPVSLKNRLLLLLLVWVRVLPRVVQNNGPSRTRATRDLLLVATGDSSIRAGGT